MTNHYFTPRDVGLDLARRLQLDRTRLAATTLGHPMEVTRAIRNLAAAGGRDLGAPDPVVWEPSGPPPVTGTRQSASGIPSFPASSIPRPPEMRRSEPVGAYQATEPGLDDEPPAPTELDPPGAPADAVDISVAADAMPAGPSSAPGTWRVVSSDEPVAMPPTGNAPTSPPGRTTAPNTMSGGFQQPVATGDSTPESQKQPPPSTPLGATVRQALGGRGLKITPEFKAGPLVEEMKILAEGIAQKAINYHQFVRDRQINASIRKY